MGNDNDVDILPQSELREAIDQQMRELSTRTVIFHHFIGERLGLNPTDHKCLDIIIESYKPYYSWSVSGRDRSHYRSHYWRHGPIRTSRLC